METSLWWKPSMSAFRTHSHISLHHQSFGRKKYSDWNIRIIIVIVIISRHGDYYLVYLDFVTFFKRHHHTIVNLVFNR